MISTSNNPVSHGSDLLKIGIPKRIGRNYIGYIVLDEQVEVIPRFLINLAFLYFAYSPDIILVIEICFRHFLWFFIQLMNKRNNLFSPILRIWESDIAISLIHLFIIRLYLFNQLHVGEYLYFPIHAKDGRRIERWIRSLLHGNGEESFKANRAIFYFPFGAPPVFPLDTIRIKQTDPLLRRNEKLIRKGGGHNRLSFIARLDRETKGDGSQRNFGPKYYSKLQVISFFKALWLGRQ